MSGFGLQHQGSEIFGGKAFHFTYAAQSQSLEISTEIPAAGSFVIEKHSPGVFSLKRWTFWTRIEVASRDLNRQLWIRSPQRAATRRFVDSPEIVQCLGWLLEYGLTSVTYDGQGIKIKITSAKELNFSELKKFMHEALPHLCALRSPIPLLFKQDEALAVKKAS